jgi:hypothetical protein
MVVLSSCSYISVLFAPVIILTSAFLVALIDYYLSQGSNISSYIVSVSNVIAVMKLAASIKVRYDQWWFRNLPNMFA